MARAGAVMVAVVVLAAASEAAGPCEEERARTGVVVAPAAGALSVAALDEQSVAGASGLRVGDTVVQVNGTVPRTCADYARAVRDARHDRKALLVLVRRSDGDVPLALVAATWDRVVAAAPPPPPAEPPSVRTLVATAPPPTLPPAAHLTLDEVLRGLGALAATEPAPGGLATYRDHLRLLHGEVATLAARGTVPANVVSGLETVLQYHDAAAVAWASENALRERERRPRHLPASEATTAPFFTDSEAGTAIDEFPFLRDTVVRDPRPGALAGESAGLWRPVQARALLWEHARAEQDRLATWLGMATR